MLRNSAFNAKGSRVIIVVVQVGAVKIFAAAVEALKKKERQDETQVTTKIGGKTSLGPPYFALYNFHSQLHSPYLSQNWPFSPPNRRTLRITLLSHDFLFCGNLRNLRNSSSSLELVELDHPICNRIFQFGGIFYLGGCM
jgi:hypothetical protein